MLPKPHVINQPCQNALRKTRGRHIQRGILIAAWLMLVVTGFSGCSLFQNGMSGITNYGGWNDTVVGLRNRSLSAKAWHRRKHHFCREKYTKDFCAGFRAGYEQVAGGSDGCTPAFPPKEYWNWQFQSAEGHNRTSAWFAGYPHGARAAEEEGVNNWSQLQMSSGMQSEFQQAGMFEHQGALYPIPDTQNGPPLNSPYGIPIEGEFIPALPIEMAPALNAPVPIAVPGA